MERLSSSCAKLGLSHCLTCASEGETGSIMLHRGICCHSYLCKLLVSLLLKSWFHMLYTVHHPYASPYGLFVVWCCCCCAQKLLHEAAASIHGY